MTHRNIGYSDIEPSHDPHTIRPICINNPKENVTLPRCGSNRMLNVNDSMMSNHQGLTNCGVTYPRIPTDNRMRDVQLAMQDRVPNDSAWNPSNEHHYTPNFDMNDRTRYFNPYEYGSRQNELGPLHKPVYTGPYAVNPQTLDDMGIDYAESFPGAIRNVNVESALLQREMTNIPGQRNITGYEINRFELLPFDPQDTRHIVWQDNLPRGGYPSRNDRLELTGDF